jgi:hypothetical protein
MDSVPAVDQSVVDARVLDPSGCEQKPQDAPVSISAEETLGASEIIATGHWAEPSADLSGNY